MAYKINDDCTSCEACISECPNEAIYEGDDHTMITTDKCTECVGFFDSAQCADVCPTESCIPDPENEESKDQLLAKAKKLHPDKSF